MQNTLSIHVRRGCRPAILACAVAAGLIAGPAHAQVPTQVPATSTWTGFDIPAQPAAEALNAFARQSGWRILFPYDAVAGRQTRAVSGAMSNEAALERLLADTGLIVALREDGVITLCVGEDGRCAGARQGQDQRGMESTSSLPVASMDAIVVVGTRIGNSQPTSPVITLTRDDMDRAGAVTAADALRLIPQNFSGVNSSSANITGGNIGFTTQADIRGLGPQSTLTLVNGRRVSAAAGGGGSAVDLGLIPAVAIERIEVLTDSASALYGSDAIGGVVNFVLRQSYDGLEMSARNDWSEADAHAWSTNLAVGRSWDGGSFVGGVHLLQRDSLRFDRIGIVSSDFTAFGGGDFRSSLAGTPGNVLPLGFQYGLPFSTFAGQGGSPVFVAAIPVGQDGTNLSVADFRQNDVNMGSFVPNDLTPENRQAAAYLNVRQSLGNVNVFADVVLSRRRHIAEAISLDLLYVPATNAFSPFEEDVFIGYIFDDPRFSRFSNESKGGSLSAGAEGALAGGWSWRLFGTYSRDDSETAASVMDSVALMGALATSDAALAFNPFGDGIEQSPAVVDSILSEVVSYGVSGLRSLNAESKGTLFRLPAGNAEVALAFEHREEWLRSGYRLQGTSDNDDVHGDRQVSALAAEMLLPVVRAGDRELDLSFAGRWDRYDDFGATFNPRIGTRWKASDVLSFKASWGTAFRAPSLRQLYAAVAVSPVVQVVDPNAPGGPAVVFADVVQGGNPDLREETAETWSATVELRPRALPGFQAGLTWYRIDYRDRIRGALDGLDMTSFLSFEPALPPGLIERDAGGNLERITLVDINSASTLVEGLDLSTIWRLDFARGSVQATGAVTYYTRYWDQLIAGDAERTLSGRVGNPARWRGRLGFSWLSGNWSATALAHHVDGLVNEDPDFRIVSRSVGSQTTADFQIGYDFGIQPRPWRNGLSVRLGVANAFDRLSPFVDGQQYAGVDPQNFRVDGRSVYLQVAKQFGHEGAL